MVVPSTDSLITTFSYVLSVKKVICVLIMNQTAATLFECLSYGIASDFRIIGVIFIINDEQFIVFP